MPSKVEHIHCIEILTPKGWVTRMPYYESHEFALKDARREHKSFGDTLRVVTFTRTIVTEIADE